MKKLTLPISDEAIRDLKVGETVLLSGVMMTGRDAVHKWMNDAFIAKEVQPTEDDLAVYEAIKPILDGGIIYHCGPVVSGVETGDYKFLAAGPTTSIREEPYQADVMKYFNLKGVIGKGGMAGKTLQGCMDTPAVYFHAIGGAASLIAQSVQEVLTVHKLDFGVPEAMWVIDVKDFPVVVTMDSHGDSQHNVVEGKSQEVLANLMKK
ncbi:MAG: fumarate hydrolyase [Anaerolineae bacterium]|jgi:fumarate hydratase subunit beta|nr:fumarate hydrolyase [Anaerolineae bacterium]MBT7191496.1 fumarate hydrolyase [Anaerolineae bacterium]MBT7989903.1 fumarate hydrolyase [Anaerolineae bacterium]